jgi:hypothetical protein
MASSDRVVAGLPFERSAQGHATIVAGGAMSMELHKLHHKAAVLTTLDLAPQVCAATVAYELHRQFCLPHWYLSVSPHKPENFLICFDYPEERDTIIHAGSLLIDSTIFQIHPWHLESYTHPSDWFFHVRICVKHLPLHTCSAEGIRQVLGDVVVFDYMDAS